MTKHQTFQVREGTIEGRHWYWYDNAPGETSNIEEKAEIGVDASKVLCRLLHLLQSKGVLTPDETFKLLYPEGK